jgi:glyoxylase-like metal-dependent hydrolase (beta-lactamase superfamily II)
MEKFDFNEIQTNFYSIEQGLVRSFMIIGDKNILLIDTGLGGNQLLMQVRKFSDLPIKVIYTHADMDHVGDAGDFEQRFMHPSEFDYYYEKTTEPIPMKAVWEGDVIEIGKYRFEVVLLPGHTPGSIGLLDREHRMMIGGDSIQSGPIFMFGPGRNFRAFRSSLIKMQGLLNDIDWIYSSHYHLKVPVSIVNQLLAGTDKMLSGEVQGEPEPRFDGKVKCYRTDGIAFFAL